MSNYSRPVLCSYCRTESHVEHFHEDGHMFLTTSVLGGGCACTRFWDRLPALLMLGAECARITAYGDARQAAERADVRKFLVGEVSKRINLMHAATNEADRDKYEAESIAIDNVYADIVEGEHVGAAEREAKR